MTGNVGKIYTIREKSEVIVALRGLLSSDIAEACFHMWTQLGFNQCNQLKQITREKGIDSRWTNI